MTARRAAITAALVLTALVAGLLLAWWRDPYFVVRGEFARQRLALGLARHSAVIDGQRWVYVVGGQPAAAAAPTIVLLHGYTGSKENWYPVAARLMRRYRVVIPDLPGWGESQRSPGLDYGYDAQAGRVAAFIGRLGDAPVVLVGHSMGGGIAAITAARYPQQVARVALFNAAGVRFDDNHFGREVLAGRNPFAVEDAASLERYLGILFFDPRMRPPLPWPAGRALIARRRAEAEFEQAVLDGIGRGEARFRPGELAGAIGQPALLLWCREDAVIDASAMALFAAKMPHARSVLLTGCGHMSLMEQPDVAAAAVVALVEEGRPR